MVEQITGNERISEVTRQDSLLFIDRYNALPRFLHKTRFLITVQVPILELYHTRISESLDAFETLSSFLVRAVPGSLAGQVTQGRDPKSMTSGTEGSQRLVKAYVSAKWMAKTLASWGEDLVCRICLARKIRLNPCLQVLPGVMARNL